MKLLLQAAIALAIIQSPVLGQPGTLDSTFGNNGRVIENLGSSYLENRVLKTQADGKILVLANAVYNGRSKAVIARFKTNGQPDSSFGSLGKLVLFGNDTTINNGTNIILQPDGKMLVSGGLTQNVKKPFICRLTTNGSFDSSFNGTGLVILNEANAHTCNGFVLLPNGKIVGLAVYEGGASTLYFTLLKLNENGSADNSFGTNGKTSVELNSSNGPFYELKTMAIQSDGKFVIAGLDGKVVRINANGSLDISFGNFGIVSAFQVFSYNASGKFRNMQQVGNLLLQPDGKMLICGYRQNEYPSPKNLCRIIRMLANGNFDSSFNGDGIMEIPDTLGYKFTGQIALQNDGKIIVGGISNTNSNYDFALARITSNGFIDPGFNGNGFASVPFTNRADIGDIPFVQNDGNILLTGFCNNGVKESIGITRVTNNGSPDNSFGAGSITILEAGMSSDLDMPVAVYVQPDQKIVNMRVYGSGITTSLLVTRHLPDGTTDNAFGNQGKTYYPLPGDIDNGTIQRLNSGKIMITLESYSFFEGQKIYLLRLNDNGLVDSSYGTNGIIAPSIFLPYIDNSECTIVDTSSENVYLSYRRIGINFPFKDSNYLVRLLPNGNYDNSFGTGGKFNTGVVGISKIVIQSDGKLVCGGTKVIYDGSGYYIRRLNSNGTPDMSFNNGQTIATGLYDEQLMTLQADNKLVICDGFTTIRRYQTNGLPDSSFGIGGDYTIPADMAITHIVSQPDNKIVFCGAVLQNNMDYGCQVSRTLANGTTDSSFGTNGTSVFNLRNYADFEILYNCTLQADGKIVLVGTTDTVDLFAVDEYTTEIEISHNKFGLVRLNGDGNPGITYMFTGTGNWSDSFNWTGNTIPISPLPAGSEIIINPFSGSCVLNVPVTIAAGGKITVKAGKSFIVQGNLTLQ